jgi:hypothetical protein
VSLLEVVSAVAIVAGSTVVLWTVRVFEGLIDQPRRARRVAQSARAAPAAPDRRAA